MRLIALPGETQRALGFTHKAILNYTDLTAAGLTQTLQLLPSLQPADVQGTTPATDWLPQGVLLGPVMLNLITPFAGPSLSSLTCALQDPASAGRYLAAANTDLFTALASNTKSTAMGTVSYTYNANDVANNSGALQAAFTAVGCNLNALTAGQVEVYFRRCDIYRLAQVAQP